MSSMDERGSLTVQKSTISEEELSPVSNSNGVTQQTHEQHVAMAIPPVMEFLRTLPLRTSSTNQNDDVSDTKDKSRVQFGKCHQVQDTATMHEQVPKRQKLVVGSSIHTEIKDLPDELMVEILCRLPHHKYVFQCKCVSQRWLSLISNSCFVRRFVTHHQSSKNKSESVEQPWAFMCFKILDYSFRSYKKYEENYDTSTPKLISKHSEFKSPGFSLKFLPCYQDQREEPTITMVKTFNDLMLCCVDKFDQSSCVYYICNPLTKQWLALPPTPPLSDVRCSEVEFICEPYYCNKIDQHHHIINTRFKFKVFRFLTHSVFPSPNSKLQIFSSETGQWNLTELSLSPKFHNPPFGFTRSFVCKEKLILLVCSKRPHRSLSFIIVDDHFDHCLQRVRFPGGKFCRNKFRSIIHVSSWQGSLHAAQISINVFNVDEPDHGVPFLRVWELKLDGNGGVVKWELRHIISFRNIVSGDEWISEYYLKERSFIIGENEQLRLILPMALGFHPGDANLLYLNLHCDDRMAFYDIRKTTLNCVSETWWRSSFPSYYFPMARKWSDVSQIVLPLWPTPLPQISKFRDNCGSL
ncbi:hypothetical protein L6164_037581 [Bauhinia variegata]|uniref:Uncharacterized protein n=1 Tax=Bauhinia variegata TaxID=167791 RepID=A0ACB9KKF0_BAUVA|nr:hypothetical protein L6164_037581 [Bauhinia variegata]